MSTRSRNARETKVVDEVESDKYCDVVLDDIEVVDDVDPVRFVLQKCAVRELDIQLWYVLCGIVGDSICREKRDGERSEVVYEMCFDRASLQSLRQLDADLFPDVLKRNFPLEILPKTFLELVNSKFDGDIKTKFLKDHPHMANLDQERKRELHFGYLVWNDFLESRFTVISSMNVYWTLRNLHGNVKPRGLGNKTGLLNAVRHVCYEKHMSKVVKKKIANRFNYWKKMKRDMSDNIEELQKMHNDITQEEMGIIDKRLMDGMPLDFFPREWLCFVLFGRPCYDSCLDSYCETSSLKRRGGQTIIDMSDDSGAIKKARTNVSGVFESISVSLSDQTMSSISSNNMTTVIVKNDEQRSARVVVKDTIAALSIMRMLRADEETDKKLWEQSEILYQLCIEEKRQIDDSIKSKTSV